MKYSVTLPSGARFTVLPPATADDPDSDCNRRVQLQRSRYAAGRSEPFRMDGTDPETTTKGRARYKRRKGYFRERYEQKKKEQQ